MDPTFLILSIFLVVPTLSIFSLFLSALIYIQSARTRRYTSHALQQLQLDHADLANAVHESLNEKQHADNLNTATSTSLASNSTSNFRPPHILSYALEFSLITHLQCALKILRPPLTTRQISAIVSRFGNAIQGLRGEDWSAFESVPATEIHLSNTLRGILQGAEAELTSAQILSVVCEFRERFRELCEEDGFLRDVVSRYEMVETTLVAGEDGESAESTELTQSWSGSTLVQTERRQEENVPLFGLSEESQGRYSVGR